MQSQITNGLLGDPLMASLGVSTADLAVDTRGYWARWLPPLRRTSGGNQVATAKRCYIGAITLPRKITFDRLTIGMPTSGNGNVLFGVYADNTDTPAGGSLLASTAAIPTANPSVASFASPVQLPQGLYWLAIMTDNGADVFIHASGVLEIGGALDGVRYDSAVFALTDPCPAVTNDVNACPNVLLRVKSIDA